MKSIVLAAAAALAFACGCATAEKEEEKPVKVLSIGNSFSISLMRDFPQVAAGCGVKLDFVSLYIGGCSLERHWRNAERDGEEGFRPYRMNRNCIGKSSSGNVNVCEMLRAERWDIITIQQASHDSWRPERYEPFGAKLIAKIRELQPQAEIVVQETWSYTPWDKRLAEWKLDQNGMYDRLHAAYGQFAARHGLRMIPFGTAVQEWRRRLPVEYAENSFGGDVVGGGNQAPEDHFKRDPDGKWKPNCDVFHLSRAGEYFQALVWTSFLFPDADLERLEYRPACVSEPRAKLMRQIAAEMAK